MLKAVILAALVSVALANPTPPRSLNVVGIIHHSSNPYLSQENGTYSGFLVDLMNEVATKLGVDYSLYLSPDGYYGVRNGSDWNGMIGELVKGEADLVLADLTVTEARREAVDFSAPYLRAQLNALLSKESTIGSLNELAAQNDVAYGTLSRGSTATFFQTNDNATVRQMWEAIQETNSTVNSYNEGVEKVKNGGFAFIGESRTFEYLIGRNCDLKTVGGWDDLGESSYALALQKGSNLTETVSDAIRELEANGDIDRLYQKWWAGECSNEV